jgi:hypothetical protein
VWKLVVAAVVACNSTSPPPVAHHGPVPSGAAIAATPSAEALCCCERLHPSNEAAGAPWESRAGACAHGTPQLPEGRCVDYARCGLPSGVHRTLADRPELAARVAIPAGSCCCATTGAFRVVAQSVCAPPADCLEPEWCETARPARPATRSPAPLVDRCVQIADHFEPWRSKQYWKDEIAPRAKLIADCKAQHWSIALEDCLLAASSPLELDGCVDLQ